MNSVLKTVKTKITEYFKVLGVTLLHNVKQALIAFDQLVQTLIGVIACFFCIGHKIYADESMSAYSHRHAKNYWYGRVMEFCINCLMYVPEKLIYGLGWGHCERSYESEMNKTQLHPDYRKDDEENY